MLGQVKSLAVVMAIALTMFWLAKPVCLHFMPEADFTRRRNVWLLLTAASFLSPNFLIYALIAAPVMAWAGAKDSNPLALYLVLYLLIPPMDIDLPLVGKLFPMNQSRLLGLTVLLPAVLTRTGVAPSERQHGITSADVLLLAFGALHLALFAPYESITNTMRRAVLYGLDTYLLYFAFSRLSRRADSSTDALACLTLVAVLLAPMGVFESVRQWLLFTGISSGWGAENSFSWLLRGDKLRAQASTGHALGLGWLLAVGTGFWTYLRSMETSKLKSLVTFVLLAAGLLFTYSRAPWITAALIPVVYFALTTPDASSFVKKILLMCVVSAAVLATPFGSDIADKLPFIGNADQDTVAYRQQLAETSWRLIQEHPWLGNPFVLLEMEELRQGQGIIDLVNGFNTIALYYGLIGLSLYAGTLLIPSLQCFSRMRRARAQGDQEIMMHTAALVACMVGTVFYVATSGPTWFQWALIGLMNSSRYWTSAWNDSPSSSSASFHGTRAGRAMHVRRADQWT